MFGGHKRFRYVRSLLDFLISTSYEFLLALWFLSTVAFAIVYWLLSYYAPEHAPTALLAISDPLTRFWDAFYFSIITATSTGFGDIVPHGASKALAALESVSDIIVMALFVAKFSASRQEMALEEIHELSYDSAFHSIRQGLFIARKDLDRLIEKVSGKEHLSEKDWRNLYISFHQVQIFIKQIPNMYNVDHRSFELGIDRELPLLDAVERTMRRATEAVVFFKQAGVSYAGHAGSVREMVELSAHVHKIFPPLMKKTVDEQNQYAFGEILERANELDAELKGINV